MDLQSDPWKNVSRHLKKLYGISIPPIVICLNNWQNLSSINEALFGDKLEVDTKYKGNPDIPNNFTGLNGSNDSTFTHVPPEPHNQHYDANVGGRNPHYERFVGDKLAEEFP